MKSARWFALAALLIVTALFSASWSNYHLLDTGLPIDAQPVISNAIGKDTATFHLQTELDGWHAMNTPQGLAARFTASGAKISANDAIFSLTFAGMSYDDTFLPAALVQPQVSENRIDYVRDGIIEWYTNRALRFLSHQLRIVIPRISR